MLGSSADPVKRLASRLLAGRSIPALIEYGLIAGLVGLACITAWMHFSASLRHPAVESTILSVETTGSVRSREPHRALHKQRTASFP
jgi:Flp pilus assembly pilin Flp